MSVLESGLGALTTHNLHQQLTSLSKKKKKKKKKYTVKKQCAYFDIWPSREVLWFSLKQIATTSLKFLSPLASHPNLGLSDSQTLAVS